MSESDEITAIERIWPEPGLLSLDELILQGA